jgi:hypothetical protein
MSVRTKKILLFLGLTFFIDWSLVGLYLALGGKTDSAGMALLAVFYMFIPMLVAIIVQKRIFRQPLAVPLGISFKVNRWFFIAWFLPPVIAFTTLGISLLLPGVTFTPDMSGFLNSLSGALTPEQMELAQRVSFADYPDQTSPALRECGRRLRRRAAGALPVKGHAVKLGQSALSGDYNAHWYAGAQLSPPSSARHTYNDRLDDCHGARLQLYTA